MQDTSAVERKRTLWSGDYRPLRVVAHLRAPIAMLPHDGLPLDGILEYAAFQLGWPPVLQYPGFLPRLTDRDPANFVLPVKRSGHKCDPDWFWCASWACFPGGFELDRTHWNRRFDGCDPELTEFLNFGGRRGAVGVGSGRYKSYHMPMCLIVAPRVEWYCMGAADGIAKLLREVTHLGHKRSQGYGELTRWEIHAMRQDWSCRRDGLPTRPLPCREGEAAGGLVGIRAPYWHPSRRRPCVLPAPRVPGMIAR